MEPELNKIDGSYMDWKTIIIIGVLLFITVVILCWLIPIANYYSLDWRGTP